MDICKQFQTPISVCEFMADLVPLGAVKVLEPTKGMGNLESVLIKRGYEVDAPDDFFLLDMDNRYHSVILNPPFSSKSANLTNAPDGLNLDGMRVGYYILERSMEMSDSVIALMPWFTISDSDVRFRKLVDYGLKSVTPLPRKTFQYARIQTVIIELQKGYKGKTLFNTINFNL